MTWKSKKAEIILMVSTIFSPTDTIETICNKMEVLSNTPESSQLDMTCMQKMLKITTLFWGKWFNQMGKGIILWPPLKRSEWVFLNPFSLPILLLKSLPQNSVIFSCNNLWQESSIFHFPPNIYIKHFASQRNPKFCLSILLGCCSSNRFGNPFVVLWIVSTYFYKCVAWN